MVGSFMPLAIAGFSAGRYDWVLLGIIGVVFFLIASWKRLMKGAWM